MNFPAPRVAPEETAFRPVLALGSMPGFPGKQMSTFWQKYKDPRWQKKRLEVMQREHFMCQSCGDNTITLNVHHKRYKKGADPWDYHDHELACLCEHCHEEEHSLKDRLNIAITMFNGPELEMLVGYAEALASAGTDYEISLETAEQAMGAADYCLCADEWDVISLQKNGGVAGNILLKLRLDNRRRLKGEDPA